ncbi:MAG: DUF4276 family protein [Verrucomicrobia bacterium]|nr:DUF4276 family protein [Verrucomicrobiota bacterium]
MHRVLIVVEGFTERTIVEQTFAPHLGARGVSLHGKIIGKPGHKGGIRNFDAVRKEILALLKQERASHVSTFFDYYGLPDSWPGVQQAKGEKAQEIAGIVEAAMRSEVAVKMDSSDDPNRFVPYIQMHELEALLFSDTKVMSSAFERPDLEPRFTQIVHECGECEEINDHEATAPSKRIERLFSGYRKGSGLRAHAPIIVRRIGMDRIRGACPHFNGWIQRLEDTGS